MVVVVPQQVGLPARELRNHSDFENGTVRDTVVCRLIDNEWPTVNLRCQIELIAWPTGPSGPVKVRPAGGRSSIT